MLDETIMTCQRCVLPIEDFSEVVMDGTLMLHQDCYLEGIAELNVRMLSLPASVSCQLRLVPRR